MLHACLKTTTLGLAALLCVAFKPMDPNVLEVDHFIDRGGERPLILIQTSKDQPITTGQTFLAYRPARQGQVPLWVQTGRVQVIEVQPGLALARVTQNGTDRSKIFHNRFPGIMAKDLLVEQQVRLTPQVVVTPKLNIPYADIFIDPKATPHTFELSETGKRVLRERAAGLAETRLSSVLIEGFTDTDGPSDANQVESYQRALTVRQFLIDDLGFHPDRLVALGQGEDEIIDPTHTAGHRERNRRIVIKALPGSSG